VRTNFISGFRQFLPRFRRICHIWSLAPYFALAHLVEKGASSFKNAENYIKIDLQTPTPSLVESSDHSSRVVGGGVASACDKQTNETQTFSPIAGVRRAIATKLGMLIEEVPSIFAVRKHFSIRSIV